MLHINLLKDRENTTWKIRLHVSSRLQFFSSLRAKKGFCHYVTFKHITNIK